MTGSTVPDGAAVDSINQLPVLLEETDQAKRTSVVLAGISDAIAFREGDWKLIQANSDKAVKSMGSGANAADTRFALAKTDKDLLFNLAEDPGENHDLSARHPERVAAMKKKLEAVQR